jgi:hypothetical protein
MNQIYKWFINHNVQITWFLIGYTTMGLAYYVGQDDWNMSALSAICLAALIISSQDKTS